MSAPAGTAGRSRHHEDRDARPHLPNSPTPPRQPCGGDARTQAAATEPASSLVLRRPRWCHPLPGTGRCTSDAPPRFFACSPPFPQVFATWRPDDRRSCAAAWPSGGLAPNPPGGAAGKASPSRSPGTPFGRDRTRRLYCPRLRGDVCTAGQDRRERAERCPRRRGSRRRPRIPRSRAPGPGALNDLGITPRLCRSPVDNPIRGPPELQPSGTGVLRVVPERRPRLVVRGVSPTTREMLAKLSRTAPPVPWRRARRVGAIATTAPVREAGSGPPEGQGLWWRSLRSPAPSG